MDADVFLTLADEVERVAPLADSSDHGIHHWQLVAVTGAELAATVPDADRLVLLLFALFHDSQRETDYVDPEHGPRAAALAVEMVPRSIPELHPDRLELLRTACDLHTTAPATDQPTLGTCWDADRLNLWRVGIAPLPMYLSTDEAKRPERIHWAEELQERDFSWEQISELYGLT